ncbi:MAG TPA: formimidoylglutamate deiminase [Steroidobacteraceae bacterium]|jgi:formimidoylglutamate deiminase|nr:formimidoylglutamate deiminase [Steroidobacteraceae bacterium]
MISLWFGSALLEAGWADNVRFAIAGGRIVRIDVGVEATPQDELHAVALPGVPNVHSHAFQRAMAGLTEIAGPGADSFWTWRNVMYRFVERLHPEDIEAISAFAFAEMLEAGFTRVGEFHYLHHDCDGTPYANRAELAARIAAAAHDTGIGLTLLPVFYAHSNFGGVPPGAGQRRFINDLDGFARLLEASRGAVQALDGGCVGVAPHSLRAVTVPELAALVRLAAAAPLHLHIAEQLKEVNDCIAWCGRRPVEWLLDHQPVDEHWCLVHATHVNAEETHRVAASAAVAGLCPITESNLGDGVFPAAEYLGAGGACAIGTDSNVLIDAAEELRVLEYAQRLTHRRRNVLAGGVEQSTGRRLLEMAVAGGAQALGGERYGLAVGADADIVSLDTAHDALICRRGDALLDSWIFAARAPAVDCVWRFGRKVVAGGRHIHRDAIAARYRRALAALLS